MVMIAMKMEVMKSQVHLPIKLWELSDLIVLLPYFVNTILNIKSHGFMKH